MPFNQEFLRAIEILTDAALKFGGNSVFNVVVLIRSEIEQKLIDAQKKEVKTDVVQEKERPAS